MNSSYMDWISVKDKLPEFYDWVLVVVEFIEGHSRIATAYRKKLVNNDEWYWWSGYPSDIGNVTHWMPLPELPQKKET